MSDTAKTQRNPDDTLQIRIWITQAQYDRLKLRARHHDSSVAAQVRTLMEAGEQRVDIVQELERKLDALMNYVKQHLEPLAFIAALDSAFAAENWQRETWRRVEHQFDGDKDKAKKPYQQYQQVLREQATKRLRRKLRDLDEAEFESETKEE